MRPLLLLLILSVASATSAGCFGKDDEAPPATTPTGTTPTPTGATPTGATPATPTPGGNNTTPPKPAPRDLCAVSFSFEQNVQPGTPPTHVTNADCGAVTAGYTTLTLNVTFSPEPAEAPIYAANGISVVVLDAAGTAVATCAGPAPGQAAVIPCSQPGAVTAGAYTLQFNGQGNVAATGTVQIS